MSEHHILTAKDIATRMATGHSVFSPSGAEMTMTCSESLVLNVLSDDVQTFFAAEGTVGHDVGEHWLKTGKRPEHRIGTIEEVGGFEIVIDEEMIGFVEDYVVLCQDIMEQAEDYGIEAHFNISHLTPIPGQGGTGDFYAMKWQRGWLVDLKYGKDPVFAFYTDTQEFNKQLAIYASGMFREWDWLYNFQEIEIIVCQPRLPGGTTSYTISRAELLEFEEYAKDKWALSWSRDVTRTPSIKGCRWCNVRTKCPALYLFMSKDMEDVFDDHTSLAVTRSFSQEEMQAANEIIMDDMAISPFPSLPKPVELSTPALAKLLRYRKLMEAFFNAIAAELLTRAVSDEEDIPWWKVVESRTLRRFVDDEEWIVEQLLAKGLDEDKIYERKLVSPAVLERLLHTELRMKLTEAKRWIETSGIAVKPQGRKTLAPTTDNRRESPKDGDVFDALEQL